MRDASTVITRPERGQASFGGAVPSSATVDDGTAAVAALAVEHHRDGCAIPLLVLAQTPGLLTWSLEGNVQASDDLGTTYTTTGISHHAGLGSLQTTAWLTPAVPPAARTLTLNLDGIRRVSSPRGGVGIERDMPGGARELTLDLCPARTRCDPPAAGADHRPDPDAARTPTRGLIGFEGLLPIGQARIDPTRTTCAWAIERYRDRAVLTMALLHAVDEPPRHIEVEVWDDLGTAYAPEMLHEASFGGWTELAITLTPGVDPAAARLGIAVTHGEDASPVTLGVHGPGAGTA